MAEHNYTLTIQMGSEGGSQSPIAGQSNQAQETPSEGGFTAQTAVEALVSFKAFVEPIVQPMDDGYIQTISLRTGSQEAQDRIQFAYKVGAQVKNFTKNEVKNNTIKNAIFLNLKILVLASTEFVLPHKFKNGFCTPYPKK